jgi:hypothetical protein
MALDKGESANLWAPLAITVIGGMISSTMLTPFVVPCLYLVLEDIRYLFKFIVKLIMQPVLIVRKFLSTIRSLSGYTRKKYTLLVKGIYGGIKKIKSLIRGRKI